MSLILGWDGVGVVEGGCEVWTRARLRLGLGNHVIPCMLTYLPTLQYYNLEGSSGRNARNLTYGEILTMPKAWRLREDREHGSSWFL